MNAGHGRTATSPRPAASELLAGVFPEGVVAFELRDEADPRALYAEEATLCKTFSRKREVEFAGGRLCARRALADVGIEDFPLLVNPDRTALWPESVVGSITHTQGFCGVALARRKFSKAIGVDAEVRGRVSKDLWPLILTPAEAALLDDLPDSEKVTFAAITFSAKEAFYKCQFSLTGAWLDFDDVELALDWESANRGSFTVTQRLSTELNFPHAGFTGRFRIDGDLVATGVFVPASDALERGLSFS
jgi:4'-phosphopantetheinyl transferase EntD